MSMLLREKERSGSEETFWADRPTIWAALLGDALR